ncbi:MAG: hypothetical protein AB1815_06400 [Bacillota bacterium]
MPDIVKGRTRGGYLTIENYILDGLLEYGSIDLAGFYSALKRFIDRRVEQPGNLMKWTVNAFCKKFKIGHDRFYKMADMLWCLGLLDVEKQYTQTQRKNTSWSNKYILHDFPPYEGSLRQYRSGSFRSKKATDKDENHIETGEDIDPTWLYSGIPDSGIPESGIPESGSINKQLIEKITNIKKQDPSINQSSREIHVSRARTDGWMDEITNLDNKDSVLAYLRENTGATDEQIRLAITRTMELKAAGKVKSNLLGLLLKVLETVRTEDVLKQLADDKAGDESEKFRREKKEFIKSLYLC